MVRKYLADIGATITSIRHFKTEATGHPITCGYIEGFVEKDQMDELIKWLDENLKHVASITL